jgi:hypothetical protein
LPFCIFGRHLLRPVPRQWLGRLLDQRDDVAHAEDPVGDALRGWNSSSASIFSPVPISLIGLPVTARIDSAAPPRPSPSMRVSTRPVMPTRSSKLRQVDGVLTGQRVGHQQDFMRVGGALISAISAISGSSIWYGRRCRA